VAKCTMRKFANDPLALSALITPAEVRRAACAASPLAMFPEQRDRDRASCRFVQIARIPARASLPLDVGKFLHRALAGGAPLDLAHVRGGIPKAHAIGKRLATATRFARR
jgi:hypothetical protein